MVVAGATGLVLPPLNKPPPERRLYLNCQLSLDGGYYCLLLSVVGPGA